jgi:hypothetical protein
VKDFQVLLELFSPQAESGVVCLQDCRRADMALEALPQISGGIPFVS